MNARAQPSDPKSASSYGQEQQPDAFVWSLAIGMVVTCGVAGGGLAIVVALCIDLFFIDSMQLAAPRLSSGQQFGMITIPLCATIGGGMGLALAIARLSYRVRGAIILIAVGTAGCVLNISLWQEQVKRYGTDTSEMVLYYPPLMMCILSVAIAFPMLLIGVVQSLRANAERN